MDEALNGGLGFEVAVLTGKESLWRVLGQISDFHDLTVVLAHILVNRHFLACHRYEKILAPKP